MLSNCRNENSQAMKQRKEEWLKDGAWLYITKVNDDLIRYLSGDQCITLCVEIGHEASKGCLNPVDLLRVIYALNKNKTVYTLILKNAFNTDQFDFNTFAKNKVLTALAKLMMHYSHPKEVSLDGNHFSENQMKLLQMPQTNLRSLFFRYGDFGGLNGLIAFIQSFVGSSQIPYLYFDDSIPIEELINSEGQPNKQTTQLIKLLYNNPLLSKKLVFDEITAKLIDNLKQEYEYAFGGRNDKDDKNHLPSIKPQVAQIAPKIVPTESKSICRLPPVKPLAIQNESKFKYPNLPLKPPIPTFYPKPKHPSPPSKPRLAPMPHSRAAAHLPPMRLPRQLAPTICPNAMFKPSLPSIHEKKASALTIIRSKHK